MNNETSVLKSVIRRKCLYCCTGSIKMAAKCNIESCPLWPYRPEMPARRTGRTKKPVQITIDYLIETEKNHEQRA